MLKQLLQSIKTFLLSDFLKITIIPFVLTGFVLVLLYNTVLNAELSLFENMTFYYESTNNSDFENILDRFSLSNIFIEISLFLSIFVVMVIISLMTKHILQLLGTKYYPTIEIKGFSSNFDIIFMIFKTLFFMMIIVVLLTPFYFIPYINIIAFNLPLYYFFHKIIVFDVGSLIMSRYEYAIMKLSHSEKLRQNSFVLYLISLIPVIGVFLSVLYIIHMGHIQFKILQMIRDGENSE